MTHTVNQYKASIHKKRNKKLIRFLARKFMIGLYRIIHVYRFLLFHFLLLTLAS